MTATAAQVAGHFGELMQGRIGADGPLALISLPCAALRLSATARPARGLSVHTASGGQIISPQRAARFLASLGLSLPARVTLRAQMPVGAGAGASTAALVALAQLAGWQGSPDNLARACLRAEGASDPLMLPNAERLLWASREGRVLARLPALPAFDILGGFWGPPSPTQAADLHFPDISSLLPAWIDAARSQNLDEIARLATTSAIATLQLRGPANDPSAALATALGAKGFFIAHTGSARGLIFARGGVPAGGRAMLRAAGLHGTLVFGHRPQP
ncbi:MAG: propanediol utilization protein [Cypionkella sp.]